MFGVSSTRSYLFNCYFYGLVDTRIANILCPSQPRVCTLIADTREISTLGLKYLYRKFAMLEFLPSCNVIPVMISTLNQEVDLNGVPTHSKYTQTLACLTCSTGLNVNEIL